MAQLSTTFINGSLSVSQPATSPQHCVRLQEFTLALSGVAPLGHSHNTADVTDFSAAVAAIVSAQLADGVPVQLQPGGGLLSSDQGLAIDPSQVSQPGHRHWFTDVMDLPSVVTDLMSTGLQSSSSVQWNRLTPSVLLKSDGGLLLYDDGLYVDFGSGATQAAPGNHTHSQLHSALTLAASNTLTLNLNGQQLSAEVCLAALSGLAVQSGLAVDFGAGHNQAARGDHTHPAPTLMVANTSSLSLGVDGTGFLSGVVRCDPAPGAGKAPLSVGSNGLYLALGTSSNTPAAGDHGHATASANFSGFMSSSDKAKLDGLDPTPLTFNGPLLLNGHTLSLPAATAMQDGYMPSGVRAKVDSLDPVPLSFTAPLTLVGHTVSIPPASTSTAGSLSAADKTKLDSLHVLTFSGPLMLTGSTVSLPAASSSQDGYLSAGDKQKLDNWLTFSTPLSLSGNTVSLPAASSTQDGYMSSSDWSALHNLIASGGSNVYAAGTLSGTLTIADGLAPAIQFGTSPFSLQHVLDNGTGIPEVQFLNYGSPALALNQNGLTLSGSLLLSSGQGVKVNGIKVLGDQQAAIDDAATAGTPTATANGYGFASAAVFNNFRDDVNGAIAQLNRVLAVMRAHGLIASS